MRAGSRTLLTYLLAVTTILVALDRSAFSLVGNARPERLGSRLTSRDRENDTHDSIAAEAFDDECKSEDDTDQPHQVVGSSQLVAEFELTPPRSTSTSIDAHRRQTRRTPGILELRHLRC